MPTPPPPPHCPANPHLALSRTAACFSQDRVSKVGDVVGWGGGLGGGGKDMERGNTAPLCTRKRNSDVLGAPHGSPDCLLQSAGGGAASLLPLMPPPALPTLLLSQIGQIQALLVGNCDCGNGGGGGAAAASYESGFANAATAEAATAEVAGRTRGRRPPYGQALSDCDDAAALVQVEGLPRLAKHR